PLYFVGPHILLFLVFILIPSIYGIYASFTQWNLVSDPQWVGLDNYKTILGNSDSTFYSQFFNGMKNTLIFVGLSVPLLIIIPLAVAVALEHKEMKLASLFQTLIYIPGLVSISAAALIWSLIFNKQLGVVNNFFGSETVWASEQPYAWIIIIIITVWAGIGG